MSMSIIKTIAICALLKGIVSINVSPFASDVNCRLSCSNDNTELVENQRLPRYNQGTPGKMGPIGPIGQPGPPGHPGPKGDSCDCPDVYELVKKLNKLERYLAGLASKDCSDEFPRINNTGLGKYTIYPFSNNTGLQVLCDQSTDGGGWTVIQRRVNNSTDFYRNWTEYQRGFGNLDTNFWLGLDNIHELLKAGSHEVRFDMENFQNNYRYAKYRRFTVGPSSENYVMTTDSYTGDAGDSFSLHSGQQFSTFDADHDSSSGNCAKSYKGGWWYKNCHHANPNGLYHEGANTASSVGINWKRWLGYEYSLKKIEIKIRKNNA